MDNAIERRLARMQAKRDAATTSTDYTGLSGSSLVNDRNFLNDVRGYYRDQGKTFSSNSEMIDNFYTDRRWKDVNSLSAGMSLLEYGFAGEDQGRLSRLSKAWRNAPPRGSTLDKVKDYGIAAVLDPINVIPTVSAGRAAQATRLAALGAGQTAEEAAKLGVRQGTRQGAISEAKINAGIEVGFDAASQAGEIQQGVSEEYDPTRTLLAGTLGATAGGTIGYGLSNIAAKWRTGKPLTKAEEGDIAKALGIEPEQLTDEQIRAALGVSDQLALPAPDGSDLGALTGEPIRMALPAPRAAPTEEIQELFEAQDMLNAERQSLMEDYQEVFGRQVDGQYTPAQLAEMQELRDRISEISEELNTVNVEVTDVDVKLADIKKAEEGLADLNQAIQDPQSKTTIGDIEAAQASIASLKSNLSVRTEGLQTATKDQTDIFYDVPVSRRDIKVKERIEDMVAEGIVTFRQIKEDAEAGNLYITSSGNFTSKTADEIEAKYGSPTADTSDKTPTADSTADTSPGKVEEVTEVAAVEEPDALSSDIISSAAKEMEDTSAQVARAQDDLDIITSSIDDMTTVGNYQKAAIRGMLNKGEISQEAFDILDADIDDNFFVTDDAFDAAKTGRPTDKQLEAMGAKRSMVEAPKRQKGVPSIENARKIYTGPKAEEIFARYDKLQNEIEIYTKDKTTIGSIAFRPEFEKALKKEVASNVKRLTAEKKKSKSSKESDAVEARIVKEKARLETDMQSYDASTDQMIKRLMSEQQDALKEFTDGRFDAPEPKVDNQTKYLNNLEEEMIAWKKKRKMRDMLRGVPEVDELTNEEIVAIEVRLKKDMSNFASRSPRLEEFKRLNEAQQKIVLDEVTENRRDTLTREKINQKSKRIAGTTGKATENIDIFAGKNVQTYRDAKGNLITEATTQGMLRKSRATRVKKRALKEEGFEAVKARAELDADQGKLKIFYEFKGTGRERVIDRGSKPKLSNGEVGYYNHVTGQKYANIESLKKEGLLSEAEPAPETTQATIMSEGDFRAAEQTLQNKLGTQLIAGGDFNELMAEYLKESKALNARYVQTDAPSAEEKIVDMKGAEVTPEEPVIAGKLEPVIKDSAGNSMRIAIIPKDPNFKFVINGKEKVYGARMLGQNQSSVDDLFGEGQKNNRDQWVIAYLPSNFPKRDMSNPKKVRAKMQTVGKKEPTTMQKVEAMVNPKAKPVEQEYVPPARPLEMSKDGDTTKISMSAIRDGEPNGSEIIRSLFTLSLLNPKTKGKYKSLLDFSNSNLSLREMDNIIETAESQDWKVTIQVGGVDKEIPYSLRVMHLKNAYSVMKGVAPEGIKLNNTDIDTSINQALEIFKKAGKKQKKEIARLLKIVVPENMAPRFFQTKDISSAYQTTQQEKMAGENTIRLNPKELEGTGINPVHLTMHELGHWVYRNMMSYEDRAFFWDNLSKFYDEDSNFQLYPKAYKIIGKPEYDSDGNFVKNVEGTRTPSVSGVGIVSKTTPQEYFANQFVAYMMNQQGALVVDTSLMEKVKGMVKKLWKKLIDPDYEDTDLTKFFDRLIKDKNDAARAAHSNPVEPTDDFSRFIQTRFDQLQILHRSIDSKIRSGDTASAADELLKLANTYRSMAFNKRDGKIAAQKKKEPYNDARTGVFAPIKPYAVVMKRWAKQINDELRIEDTRAGDVQSPNASGYSAEALSAVEKLWGKTKMSMIGDDTAMATDPMLANLNDVIMGTLNSQYKNVTGGDIPSFVPASIKMRRGRPVGSTGRKPHSIERRNAINNARQRKNIQVTQQMMEAASEDMKKSASAAVKSGQPYMDFRSMDLDTLMRNWDRFGDSRQRTEVAQFAKDLSHKLPPSNVATTNRLFKQGADYKQIMDLAWKAKQDGNADHVMLAIRELQARKSSTGKYDPTQFDAAVLRAVDAEHHFNQGDAAVLGVPAKAPFALRSFLTAITHRKPRIAYVARTMSARLAYLGVELPSNPASEGYNNYRNTARKSATTLEKAEDITPVVRLVSDLLLDAELVDEATYELMGQLGRKFGVEPKKLVADIIIQDNDMKTKPTTVKSIMDQVSGEERFALEDAINDIRQNITPSLGYVMKGLIANPNARKRFPFITLHGEMVSPDVTMPKGSPTVHFTESVPAEHAKNYVDDVLDNLDPAQLMSARRFTDSETPQVYYASVSKLGGLSGGVRIKSTPDNFIERMRTTIIQGLNDDNASETVNDLLDELELVTDEIAYLSVRAEETSQSRSHLNNLFEFEKSLRKELRDTHSIGEEIETIPVFVRDTKPAVFGDVVSQKNPLFTEIAQAILRNNQGRDTQRAGEILMESETGGYETLVNMAGSKSKLHRIMKDIGFSSVQVNGAKTLFNSSDMRYIRDYALRSEDLNHTVGLEKKAHSANVAFVDAAMLGKDEGENLIRSVMSAMESVGVSPRFIDAMDKKRRGKQIGEGEAQEMRKAATLFTTKNNAEITANAGMTFISRVFNPLKGGGGHYERHAVAVSKICTPLLRKLNDLPDGGNLVSRWWRDSAVTMYDSASGAMGGAIGFVPKARATQPQSHSRILAAARMGDVTKLKSKDEVEIFNMLRTYFDNTLVRMRQAGMQVGNISRNYVPQVYRKDLIEADREEFERRLSLYFLAEDAERPLGPDRVNPLTEVEARAKAFKMADSIVADDGVMRPHDLNIKRQPAEGKSADHTFQRVIRLDTVNGGMFNDPTNPNNLQDFLENDIMIVVSKYSDAAERDMDLFKSFGAGHHAVDDYFIGLNANNDNMDDLIRIIKGDKVDIVTRKVRDPRAKQEQTVNFDYTYMSAPARLKRKGEAEKAAAEVVQLARGGATKAEVSEYLNRLHRRSEADLKDMNAEERTLELNKVKNFKLRAEAIADGIVTAKGGLTPVRRENQLHAKQYLNLVKRKQHNGEEGAYTGVLQTTQKWLTGFNAVTLLPFTILSSLGDSTLPLIQSGNFQAWARGVKNYAQNDENYREMITNVGAATENITFKYMTQAFGVDSTKFTNGYFNATGLTPWTEMWRNISAAIAYEHFKMMQRQAMDGPRTRQGRIAKKQLDAYGLQEFYEPNANQVETALDGEHYQYQTLAVAMNRFVNESIFTPNPTDIPVWGQTPLGKIVYQLKSFPMMMWRLHRRAWNRFLDDPMNDMDVAPLLYMYGAAPSMGFASANVKDIVQGRGGEDNRQFALRNRSLKEQFSWAENMDEDVAQYLGWYWDGFMVMGGLGLIGEMLYDIGRNVDNGAFGQVRIGEVILGPSMGLFNDGLTVGAGVSNIISDKLGGTSTNYAEREMVDTLFHRLAPPFGSMPYVRENVVDKLAGTPSGREGSGKLSSKF